MRQLKKNITFVYSDATEKTMMTILADEAKKRNYNVTLTDNKFERCEIGVYCQHVNFPKYSRFSVVMLHDIIQQYGNWPNLWRNEPWNIYDIGILPSEQWVENWNACSHLFYSRPKKGMYKVGWPKADILAGVDRTAYRKQFCQKFELDESKKTILYAPAWENDRKQDDFVRSMLNLDVNILIKQYPYGPDCYPERYKDACDMWELHKDIPMVTILDPKTNIFEAIMASDVLVSEESSTMSEALMVGIPAISVSDWIIPDKMPRYPRNDYDFVTVTTKKELAACAKNIVDNYDEAQRVACEYRDRCFCNIGNTSQMIMDIIDDCVSGSSVRYKALNPRKREKLPLKELLHHYKGLWYNNIYHDYVQHSLFWAKIWALWLKIRK